MNGNQLIDYEEFIAATIHLNKLNREEVIVGGHFGISCPDNLEFWGSCCDEDFDLVFHCLLAARS